MHTPPGKHGLTCRMCATLTLSMPPIYEYERHPQHTFVSHAPRPLMTILPSTLHNSAPKNGGT